MTDTIAWRLNEPLSKARIYVEGSGSLQKVPESLWKQKYAIKKGDMIATLLKNGEPVFATEIVKINPSAKSFTLRDILQSLHDGGKETIKPNSSNIERVEEVINTFKGEYQIALRDKLKCGKLKVKDLYGDHVFFEGRLQKAAAIEGGGSLLTYSLGS